MSIETAGDWVKLPGNCEYIVHSYLIGKKRPLVKSLPMSNSSHELSDSVI